MSIDLSQNQQSILDTVMDWYGDATRRHLTLGGYAGTGKTTLVGYLGNKLRTQHPGLKIAFCSYTGKAARVLSQKLVEVSALKPEP